MKFLITMSVMFLVVSAFGVGVFMGWDSGVRDGKNLETVQTP